MHQWGIELGQAIDIGHFLSNAIKVVQSKKVKKSHPDLQYISTMDAVVCA